MAYDHLQTVPSRTDPGATYDIKRNRTTGEISCNCRGWIFYHATHGPCRHIRDYLATRDIPTRQGSRVIVVAPGARPRRPPTPPPPPPTPQPRPSPAPHKPATTRPHIGARPVRAIDLD